MNAKGKLSNRATTVARWFGVDVESTLMPSGINAPDVRPAGGQIILLTGPSGAGKSTLLRQIRQSTRESVRWIDLGKIVLPRTAVIDVMTDALRDKRNSKLTSTETEEDEAILSALRALSQVGLGEVWTYLRTTAQLSDGQRWRLRLAIALARAAPPQRRLTVLSADEFAAPLDRVTALVVARALRKAISASPSVCAIVATTRDDLAAALQPDRHVYCDFGIYNQISKGDCHEKP